MSDDRISNIQDQEFDPRTISGYFIGYAEMSKGYRFYRPSNSTRIVESRNAGFLENDLINGIDQYQKTISIRDQPSTSSEKFIVMHNMPQVQMGFEQPINTIQQNAENMHIDQVVQVISKINEQPVEPHDPQEIFMQH